jgi:hypothetical protein
MLFEAKAEIEFEKRVSSKEVDLSLTKLSRAEHSIITTLCKYPYALNTFQIYHDILLGALGENLRRFNAQKEMQSKGHKYFTDYQNRKLKEIETDLNRAQKLWDEKKFEESAKILRNFGYEVPSYPRVRRTLDNFRKLGWVEIRVIEAKKEGVFWYLPDEIREKIKQGSCSAQVLPV